jgi:hypothetical protein
MTIDTNFLKNNKNIMKQIFKDKKTSGKYKFNKDNVEKFINGQCSEIRRQAARDLIDCTLYITIDDIFDILDKRLFELDKQLSEKNKPIALVVGDYTKSSYFISSIALYIIQKKYPKLLPSIFIDSLEEKHLTEDYSFVIIDDISYSGSQMSSALHKIYYELVIEKKFAIPEIYVCLLGANIDSYNLLSKVPISKYKGRSYSFYDEYTVSPFRIICGDLLPTIFEQVGIERAFTMILFFYPILINISKPIVSIYLDIKLADSLSTFKFALQYGPIVPSNFIKDNMDIFDVLLNNVMIEEHTYLAEHFTKGKMSRYLTELLNKIKNTEEIDKDISIPEYYPLLEGCNQDINNKLKKYKEIFYKDYFLSSMKDNWKDYMKLVDLDNNFLNESFLKGIDKKEYDNFITNVTDVKKTCPTPLYKTDRYIKTYTKTLNNNKNNKSNNINNNKGNKNNKTKKIPSSFKKMNRRFSIGRNIKI